MSDKIKELKEKTAARLRELDKLRGYTPLSKVDPTMPEEGNATTESVRDNFSHTKYEIEALQASVQELGRQINALPNEFVNRTGDTMLDNLKLDPKVVPTDPEDYATKGYVDSVGGGGGGGGLPDAPVDGRTYGRKDAKWVSLNADGSGGYAITTADVALTNPSRYTFETQEDANQYFYDEIETIKSTGGTGDSVEWVDVTDKPAEIISLDGTTGNSIVSAGSY